MATSTYAYTAEQLRDAFIEPLRSAMLIDDRFPLYSDLLAQVAAPQQSAPPLDTTEVHALLSQCRARGLMCDIENRYQDAGKPLSHIETSDLLILDYHLVPGDDTDSGPALSILHNLATSTHANLVVVYTAAPDLEEVKRGIACYFHGVPANAEATDAYLQLSATTEMTFSVEDLEGFLLKGSAGITGATKSDFATKMKTAAVKGNVTAIVTEAIQDVLRGRFRTPIINSAEGVNGRLRFSVNGSQNIWIAYRNVFVVVVKKSQQKDIFTELEAALLAWNPSPLQLLLVHARNYLEQTGFLTDWGVIADEIRHNAFFYHFLAGEEPSGEQRLGQLFRNVFGETLQGLSEYVASYGRSLLAEYAHVGQELPGESKSAMESRRLGIAHIGARSQSPPARNAVLHELNSFLSSGPFVGGHLKTGTIFRTTGSDEERYWVCVSADCGLVPRTPQDKQSWEADIYPNVPVVALRLQIERGKTMDQGLERATLGRHLFLSFAGDRLALRVSAEDARQPRPEVFILNKNTVDTGGFFEACRIHSVDEQDAKQPKLTQYKFQAVSQLRASYADRLLTQTGHHTTRIGVDFVSLITDQQNAVESH